MMAESSIILAITSIQQLTSWAQLELPVYMSVYCLHKPKSLNLSQTVDFMWARPIAAACTSRWGVGGGDLLHWLITSDESLKGIPPPSPAAAATPPPHAVCSRSAELYLFISNCCSPTQKGIFPLKAHKAPQATLMIMQHLHASLCVYISQEHTNASYKIPLTFPTAALIVGNKIWANKSEACSLFPYLAELPLPILLESLQTMNDLWARNSRKGPSFQVIIP